MVIRPWAGQSPGWHLNEAFLGRGLRHTIMTRLHLIRHGETAWNAEGRVQGQTDASLNDTGREQASALKHDLSDIPIARVYVSSSVRARDTATLAFGHLSVEFIYLDELREIYLSDWEGQLYSEVELTHSQEVHHFRNAPHQFNYPGAETFLQLQARGLAAVQDIIQQSQGLDVAVVSHGAWIKAVLSHYEGRPLSEFWQPPRMHNCSHSILEAAPDGDQPRITRYAGQAMAL